MVRKVKMKEKSDKLSKLAIACGGTGGHFYPGLTLARNFKDQGGSPLLLLSGKHTESQAETAKSYGINSVIIPSSPRPRNIKSAIVFAIDLLCGVISGRKVFKIFKADAFLAMGSFASVSGACAARSLKIPIFLHDGNARIGRANIFLSRWAKHLSLSFPAVNSNACKCPCSCSGLPVRPELLQCRKSKAEAIKELNEKYNCTLSPDLPLLLIFGGSQGAKTFNSIIPDALLRQEKPQLQVIHLTGAGKLEETKNIYKKANFPTLIQEKSDDMGILYSVADLIFCRSGGSSISEIAAFGKFAILVPYPYAADKHQDDNAAYLNTGGAIVIQDNKCTVERISVALKDWLENVESYSEAGKLNLALAQPDAATETLNKIRSYL